MEIARYLHRIVDEHLTEYRQMAFITGPRQVGKTTLALALLDSEMKPLENYFNWDNTQHRKILMREIFSCKRVLKKQRLCFDEIHKYKRWKNSLKGLFDANEPDTKWIITGSALLNIYRRGQDSLVGRHFTYTLFPLSVAELLNPDQDEPVIEHFRKHSYSSPQEKEIEIMNNLMEYSGFPEPYIKRNKSFLKRWRQTRLDRLVNQDLAQVEHYYYLDLIEHLLHLLPERVGSTLSLNSLREDLEVAHKTVRKWMESLNRMFYGFYVEPYAIKKSRMLKKEKKWYLWDWTEVTDDGACFENFVAVHLYKYVTLLNEMGNPVALHYIRDREKREIDFVICLNNRPVYAIETKLRETDNVTSLLYYARKLKLEKSLVVVKEHMTPYTRGYRDINIDVVSAASFLATLV